MYAYHLHIRCPCSLRCAGHRRHSRFTARRCLHSTAAATFWFCRLLRSPRVRTAWRAAPYRTAHVGRVYHIYLSALHHNPACLPHLRAMRACCIIALACRHLPAAPLRTYLTSYRTYAGSYVLPIPTCLTHHLRDILRTHSWFPTTLGPQHHRHGTPRLNTCPHPITTRLTTHTTPHYTTHTLHYRTALGSPHTHHRMLLRATRAATMPYRAQRCRCRCLAHTHFMPHTRRRHHTAHIPHARTAHHTRNAAAAHL